MKSNFAATKTDPSPHSSGLQEAERVSWPARALECPYSFALFGRFTARAHFGSWPQVESRRLQQVLAYLLLFRDRPHHRDVLSATLWTDSTQKQSRKNLRQSLWQLQRHHTRHPGSSGAPLLLTEKDWVGLNVSQAWADVDEFERVFAKVRTVAPEQLGEADAYLTAAAVELYRSDLLAGWEEDWCVHERDRLKTVYLALLEKLVGWYETSNRLEAGLAYGNILLEHDRANERAHWRLMRLYQRAGNRTGALRQFEKCRIALNQELGVEPGRLTRSLYEEICSSG